MRKLLQNKVAESKLALPVVSLYAIVVWILCGLLTEQWWMQFLVFAASTYLMVELNNINALIRIYSRMVSCTFLVLSCCACFLFPSLRGAILGLCIISSMMILFLTYQDKQGVGATYYAFIMLGIGSMAFVHLVFFLPLAWLFMLTHLQSLSWRTFGASLLGWLTPYWLAACYFIYLEDFTPIANHFAALAQFAPCFDYATLTISQIAVFALVLITAATGTVHYLRQRQGDKIRVRMLYGIFIWTDVATAAFLLLQPQHYDALIRINIICTAPLLAHFIALTATKATNIFVLTLLSIILLLTGYNVWTLSYLF